MNAAADGLILCAHGARDPRWAAPFESVAARVRAHDPRVRVSLAYLEFIEPTPAQAAAALAAAGCTRVAVLPLFLGAGGHVQRDLPRIVGAMRESHPGMTFELMGTVGEAERVLAAIARTAIDAIAAPGAPR